MRLSVHGRRTKVLQAIGAYGNLFALHVAFDYRLRHRCRSLLTFVSRVPARDESVRPRRTASVSGTRSRLMAHEEQESMNIRMMIIELGLVILLFLIVMVLFKTHAGEQFGIEAGHAQPQGVAPAFCCVDTFRCIGGRTR